MIDFLLWILVIVAMLLGGISVLVVAAVAVLLLLVSFVGSALGLLLKAAPWLLLAGLVYWLYQQRQNSVN